MKKCSARVLDSEKTITMPLSMNKLFSKLNIKRHKLSPCLSYADKQRMIIYAVKFYLDVLIMGY